MGRSRQMDLQIDRTTRVIDHIRSLVQAGTLCVGDRIPSELELSRALSISRSHVRAGIACLCSLGVVRLRSGFGAVLGGDPPQLPIHLLAAFHPLQSEDVREARSLVIAHMAALSAQRATQDDHTVLAEEVAEMYAAETPSDHMAHALQFQRRIGISAGNPLLAAFAEGLTQIVTAGDQGNLEKFDLQESARLHGEVYRAIRRQQPREAGRAMEKQLRVSAVGGTQSRGQSAEGAMPRSLAS